MDSLEFILIIAVFAAILGWYLLHAMRGDQDGGLGLFALRPDPEPETPSDPAPTALPADAPPRRYRRRETARYRLKDRATVRRQPPE